MVRISLPLPLAGAALAILTLAVAGATEKPGVVDRLPAAARTQVDFERQIRPIVAQKCIACHGAVQQKGGLRLDRRADALRGGDSGPAIVPGKSLESRLVHYVAGLDPKKVMPPSGGRLTAGQVGLLRAWIDQGAMWPEPKDEGGRMKDERGQPGSLHPSSFRLHPSVHWAFVPPRLPRLPAVKNQKWVRNPIDAFVLARLEKLGIVPSPEADRSTLIRRLSLDLTGLPPSPAEVDRFVQDGSPDAYERLVDRLLASQHFGERWGRHWLDLARYADSDGYEKDLPRPYAYLYRDWVINALNQDLPFDQFTIQQLAGDLLWEEMGKRGNGGNGKAAISSFPHFPISYPDVVVATGFHRNTLKNKEGGADPEEDRVKATVDRTSTTGTVWLGLTVGCAECHSHKYDPISQREFYGLYAFFNNAREVDLPTPGPGEMEAYQKAKKAFDEAHAPLLAALAAYEKTELPARQAEWEKRVHLPDPKLPEPVARVLALPPGQRSAEHQAELTKHYRTLDERLIQLSQAVAGHAKKEPPAPATRAQTLGDNPTPPGTFIHVRGDFLRKGEPVQPHTPGVLHPFNPSGEKPTRLDLARWLVDPGNPLTARVAVNRAWQHLFGRGLIGTPNDFGTRGERPSHPELLDWLAGYFVAGNGEMGKWGNGKTDISSLPHSPISSPRPWSLRNLIRLIVTSATYRQSSAVRADLAERDPRNLLLARQNRFRPEAEIVRDLYLAASGLLNPAVGGPSIRPPLPADIAALGYAGSVKWPESTGPDRYRRGMYVFFQRTVPYPQLATFDAPDSNVACTRRERSNTPLQALTLLNDPVFVECAQALGRRIAAEKLSSTEDRVRYGFRLCLGRHPSPAETARLAKLYAEMLPLCQANPEGAAKLAGGPLPPGVNAPEVAAWVVVARTIMNLDEFVTRE
jgi:mono/diheme cytochrome c family protein